MNRHLRYLTLLALAAIAAFPASAGEEVGPFEMLNSSIDCGGGRSTAGQFVLNGIIGQPDASAQSLTGGDFELNGGFWSGEQTVPDGDHIFSDGFEGP